MEAEIAVAWGEASEFQQPPSSWKKQGTVLLIASEESRPCQCLPGDTDFSLQNRSEDISILLATKLVIICFRKQKTWICLHSYEASTYLISIVQGLPPLQSSPVSALGPGYMNLLYVSKSSCAPFHYRTAHFYCEHLLFIHPSILATWQEEPLWLSTLSSVLPKRPQAGYRVR